MIKSSPPVSFYFQVNADDTHKKSVTSSQCCDRLTQKFDTCEELNKDESSICNENQVPNENDEQYKTKKVLQESFQRECCVNGFKCDCGTTHRNLCKKLNTPQAPICNKMLVLEAQVESKCCESGFTCAERNAQEIDMCTGENVPKPETSADWSTKVIKTAELATECCQAGVQCSEKICAESGMALKENQKENPQYVLNQLDCCRDMKCSDFKSNCEFYYVDNDKRICKPTIVEQKAEIEQLGEGDKIASEEVGQESTKQEEQNSCESLCCGVTCDGTTCTQGFVVPSSSLKNIVLDQQKDCCVQGKKCDDKDVAQIVTDSCTQENLRVPTTTTVDPFDPTIEDLEQRVVEKCCRADFKCTDVTGLDDMCKKSNKFPLSEDSLKTTSVFGSGENISTTCCYSKTCSRISCNDEKMAIFPEKTQHVLDPSQGESEWKKHCCGVDCGKVQCSELNMVGEVSERVLETQEQCCVEATTCDDKTLTCDEGSVLHADISKDLIDIKDFQSECCVQGYECKSISSLETDCKTRKREPKSDKDSIVVRTDSSSSSSSIEDPTIACCDAMTCKSVKCEEFADKLLVSLNNVDDVKLREDVENYETCCGYSCEVMSRECTDQVPPLEPRPDYPKDPVRKWKSACCYTRVCEAYQCPDNLKPLPGVQFVIPKPGAEETTCCGSVCTAQTCEEEGLELREDLFKAAASAEEEEDEMQQRDIVVPHNVQCCVEKRSVKKKKNIRRGCCDSLAPISVSISGAADSGCGCCGTLLCACCGGAAAVDTALRGV